MFFARNYPFYHIIYTASDTLFMLLSTLKMLKSIKITKFSSKYQSIKVILLKYASSLANKYKGWTF